MGQHFTISESLANYITGFGFRTVTPELMKSELRRRQDIIDALIKQKQADQKKANEEEWKKNHPGMEPLGS